MSGVVSSTTTPIPVQPKAQAIPLADAPQGDPLPMCVICQHGMMVQEEREALFCGHTFHKFCLSEWRRCAGRTTSECPLRCRHPDHVVPVRGGVDDDDDFQMEVDEEQRHDDEPIAPAPPQDLQAATEEVAQAGFGEPEPQQ